MSYTFISGAYKLASRGYNLFLTGRSQDKLENLKSDILLKYSVDIKVFACDLTDYNSRNQMLIFIDQENIKFSGIYNVAGVDTQKAFTEYSEEKLLFQLRVNVESTIHITHALLKRKAEKLEILTVSSMSGQSPMPYFAIYSASKAMLTNFFTSLHYELKKDGVKVTTVLPGGVYTREDVVKEIESQGLWGKLSALKPEVVAKRSIKALKKNKVKYIPGGFNKFLNFIMKLAPKKIVLSFIARRWKKHSKDAF